MTVLVVVLLLALNPRELMSIGISMAVATCIEMGFLGLSFSAQVKAGTDSAVTHIVVCCAPPLALFCAGITGRGARQGTGQLTCSSRRRWCVGVESGSVHWLYCIRVGGVVVLDISRVAGGGTGCVWRGKRWDTSDVLCWCVCGARFGQDFGVSFTS